MDLLFLLFFVPAMLYWFLIVKFGRRQTKFARFSNFLFVIYIFFILLFVATQVMETRNIFVRGYRSTSIIFLCMAIVGILFSFSIVAKPISRILRVVIILIQLITIPFASILAVEVVGDYKDQLVYDDPKYRLEETGRSMMNPCVVPALFVKSKLIEEQFFPVKQYCLRKSHIDSMDIFPNSEASVTVAYYLNDTGYDRQPNPLRLVYEKRQRVKSYNTPH